MPLTLKPHQVIQAGSKHFSYDKNGISKYENTDALFEFKMNLPTTDKISYFVRITKAHARSYE